MSLAVVPASVDTSAASVEAAKNLLSAQSPEVRAAFQTLLYQGLVQKDHEWNHTLRQRQGEWMVQQGQMLQGLAALFDGAQKKQEKELLARSAEEKETVIRLAGDRLDKIKHEYGTVLGQCADDLERATIINAAKDSVLKRPENEAWRLAYDSTVEQTRCEGSVHTARRLLDAANAKISEQMQLREAAVVEAERANKLAIAERAKRVDAEAKAAVAAQNEAVYKTERDAALKTVGEKQGEIDALNAKLQQKDSEHKGEKIANAQLETEIQKEKTLSAANQAWGQDWMAYAIECESQISELKSIVAEKQAQIDKALKVGEEQRAANAVNLDWALRLKAWGEENQAANAITLEFALRLKAWGEEQRLGNAINLDWAQKLLTWGEGQRSGNAAKLEYIQRLQALCDELQHKVRTA